MDPEEALTAELLTRLIERAHQLRALDGPHPPRSGTLIELLRHVHEERRSDARLLDLTRAAGSDPVALRAAASWALAEGCSDAASVAAAMLLFEASLLVADN